MGTIQQKHVGKKISVGLYLLVALAISAFACGFVVSEAMLIGPVVGPKMTVALLGSVFGFGAAIAAVVLSARGN